MNRKNKTTHASLRLGFAALCAATLFAWSTSPAQAQPINCNLPKADLQGEIDDAEAGATVNFVGPCDDGPYFIFGKNLNLRGLGGATLSAPAGSQGVLFIRGATVELRNLTIDAALTDAGISVEGSSIKVDWVAVEDALRVGLRLDGSSFAIVSNSEFNNDDAGVVITGNSNAFLFRNTIQNNLSNGIVLNLNGSATVQENDILGRKAL